MTTPHGPLSGFRAPALHRRARGSLRLWTALAAAALLLSFAGPARAQVCGDGVVEAPEACDDGNLLNGDCCSDTCTVEPATVVCRDSAGACDPAETCDGTSPVCPADFIYPTGSICRTPAGTCDVAELCDGVSVDCPADVISPVGTTCRAASGSCDVAETCDGVVGTCPADAFAASGATCRASSGACDVAETCDGLGAACPADVVSAAGISCRAVAGACDVAEACDGIAHDCPTDGFLTAGTSCRASAGVCDAAETCDGASAACPSDGAIPDGTACSDGDVCSGASSCQAGVCVGALPSAGGQVCRPPAGPCDIAETCDGITPACPPDGFRPGNAVCRVAAGGCDLPESCTGTGVSCPADAKRTSVCRPAQGLCDAAEYCDGVGNNCPVNQSAPNGTFCEDEGNACTRDVCLNGSCNHPAGNAGALCRSADDICDVPETCDGLSTSCPADVIGPDGVACDDGQSCTGGDVCAGGQCQGLSLTCGNGTVECDETCDDGNTVDGDACSSICTSEETCGDLIDNDSDGRLDCVAAECAPDCAPLVNGGVPSRPSRIIIKKRTIDLVRLQGSIRPATPIDPSSERVGLVISNAERVLFLATLPPGALNGRGGTRWVYRDRQAKVSGGVFSLVMKREESDAGPVYRFTIIGNGDFTQAGTPSMSVQVVVGDDSAIDTREWEPLRSGWKVRLP